MNDSLTLSKNEQGAAAAKVPAVQEIGDIPLSCILSAEELCESLYKIF